MIQQILDKCSEQQLPVIFALSRRRLAMVLKKCHKVGCVGIFSYDGAEVSFLYGILSFHYNYCPKDLRHLNLHAI